MPRPYGRFWEIMFRDTAIMGILGIRHLLFIDSAIAELRMDRAQFLLAFTGLCTLMLDWVSRTVQAWLCLSTLPAASDGGISDGNERRVATLRIGAVGS